METFAKRKVKGVCKNALCNGRLLGTCLSFVSNMKNDKEATVNI